MDINKFKPTELFEVVEASRRALLRYYNSQSMTHGGYIIALVIGFITVASRWVDFIGNPLMSVLFLVILFLLFPFLTIYLVGRTLLYGYLASGVLVANYLSHTNPSTIINQLHLSSVQWVDVRHNKIRNNFNNYQSGIKYSLKYSLVILVVSILLYLIIYYIWLILNR